MTVPRWLRFYKTSLCWGEDNCGNVGIIWLKSLTSTTTFERIKVHIHFESTLCVYTAAIMQKVTKVVVGIRSDSPEYTHFLNPTLDTGHCKTYTSANRPKAVRDKLQHLYQSPCWQVGRGVWPIIEEKGWSGIRRVTRIDLMRTWYDCWGTGETHAHLCPQWEYSIGAE